MGPLTYFGFNVAENSTGEERFEVSDIKRALDLEGISHAIVDGAEFKATPITLDIQ